METHRAREAAGLNRQSRLPVPVASFLRATQNHMEGSRLDSKAGRQGQDIWLATGRFADNCCGPEVGFEGV
jgi:hypothetical protein